MGEEEHLLAEGFTGNITFNDDEKGVTAHSGCTLLELSSYFLAVETDMKYCS